MRAGLGHVIVGGVLLAAGIGVTVTSKETVWYGAIVVGVIEIARGLYYLMRSQPQAARQAPARSTRERTDLDP
jgi:uncharacterized membrane protein